MEPKKLRRSYKDSIIGGVAGGLGEYFATDPLIFRILFVVLLFTGGGGFLIYILMWIFIPKDEPKYGENFQERDKKDSDKKDSAKEEPGKKEPISPEVEKSKSKNGGIIGGAILIMIGLFFLMDNFLPWIHFADLWPVALVIAGLAIVKMNYSGIKDKKENDDTEQSVKS